MGRILTVCGALALALALLAGMIFGFGDEATVIPAPQSVAEGLVRQLAASRFKQTRQFFSMSVRNNYTADRLRNWFHALETDVGGVLMVSGTDGEISDDRAKATVHVKGKLGDAALQMELRREHGVWVVLDLPPL